MDSVLRPRDIQTRIRAGESPEAVAAAAQTTVEKIMGFAGPVMAERAHIADQAQKASVRRRMGSSPIGHLGAAVGDHLRTRDVDPETVEWDAWRREDGRWTLVADFRLGGAAHRATFVYDVQGRYVVAEDDESRALVGERHPGTSAPAAVPSGPPAPTPAVDLVDLVADASDSDALGDDAIALVSEPPVSPASVAPEPAPEPTPAAAAAPARPSRPLSRVPDEEPELALDFDLPAPTTPSSPTSGATPSRPVERPGTRPAARSEVPAHEPTGDDSLTEDLTEAAAAFRAVPPVPGMVESGDADWMVTQATERLRPRPAPAEPIPSPAAQVPAARVEPPVAPTPAEPVSRADEPTDEPDDEPAGDAAGEPAVRQADDEQTPEPTPAKPARKPTKSRGRASVPSWDEIMFGSSKND